MNTKTHPKLHYICYATIVLICWIQQSHEYSDQMGLHVLIQNRPIGRYAPEFTVPLLWNFVDKTFSLFMCTNRKIKHKKIVGVMESHL